ncbi:extracellular solute-binding protein [Streptomyces sp. NBC_00201]|uniref:ABC transporter substrate-binding protein n=1 Tax=unclassified Streptomyces TaxID=2593676 RepID=UPI002254944A|nr:MULTISPECIES: extracellular solute-binding protein [unclassified Streptomyces]MCX5062694.1 extracellular solute-binding protein [Streptomyces sp. NBC_00452]MCX5250374.1 extracellular solute-binding protein [Streptomyces sp. NBC_00201]MCX5291698.1 extracellular solute-binding protein [Streptomyces sp. NBC_00183]
MDLSRRGFLQAAALTAAASGLTVACGGSSGSGGTKNGKNLTLWYWGGALSDKVVAEAKTHFGSQIKLTTASIGGDFKQKLTTTIAAGASVPDITGIKGEDMASFLPNASRFLDLNDLGFKKISSQYLDWKTKLAQTEDGRQIGFPIDIGPTALFYREDLFGKAGLPTDPDKVAAAVKTWDDYFALGSELTKALPGVFLVNNISSVFNIAVGQGTKRFIDKNNHFIGDQDHIRAAWTTAVRPYTLGIDAKINDNSWNAAIGKSLATELGAAWHALDIEQAAPHTKGKWRVCANPVGPSNQGGSYLALPKQCRNPEEAFKIISWILSPTNDARGFTDAAIFPAAPAAYAMPAMTGPDAFFGGQKIIDVFGPAAKTIPDSYEAPADAAVMAPYLAELTSIEAKGKKPNDAWKDAVSQAKQIARRQGVN